MVNELVAITSPFCDRFEDSDPLIDAGEWKTFVMRSLELATRNLPPEGRIDAIGETITDKTGGVHGSSTAGGPPRVRP